jgi:hypothetical protein
MVRLLMAVALLTGGFSALALPPTPTEAVGVEALVDGEGNAYFRNWFAQMGARPNGSFGSNNARPVDEAYPWAAATVQYNGSGMSSVRELLVPSPSTRADFDTLWARENIFGDFFLPGTSLEAWGLYVRDPVGGNASTALVNNDR